MEKREVSLYGPGLEGSNLLFHQTDDDAAFCQFHHIKIWRIKTIHDGERFACEPHVIYVLEMGEDVFIIGGDGILTREMAERIQRLLESQVTAVFVNVFQLLAEEKSGFIRSILPEKVFLYHMPFPEDDVNNMKYIKKAALPSYPGGLPEITELVHMSWLDSLQPVKIQSVIDKYTEAAGAASGM